MDQLDRSANPDRIARPVRSRFGFSSRLFVWLRRLRIGGHPLPERRRKGWVAVFREPFPLRIK
jgi:hypothetical protein